MAGRKPVSAEGIARQTRAIGIVWGESPDLRLSVTGLRRKTVTPDDGAASLEKAIAGEPCAAGTPVWPARGIRIEIDGTSDRQVDSDAADADEPRLGLEIVMDRSRIRETACAFRSN